MTTHFELDVGVIGGGGRMTDYSGGEGIETKLALLRLEGYRLL